MHPNGQRTDTLGVFLNTVRMPSESSIEARPRVRFTLKLVNQLDPSRSIQKGALRRAPERWCWPPADAAQLAAAQRPAAAGFAPLCTSCWSTRVLCVRRRSALCFCCST